MIRHRNPDLFSARLTDLNDLGGGALVWHLQAANQRGTLLDELNRQLRQDGHSVAVHAVLVDLLDDFDEAAT